MADKKNITDERMREIVLEVGKNLRRERLRRGLSITKLAGMSNLSVSHISKVEAAKCEIGLKALVKISTALSMEVVDFLPPIEELYGAEKMQTNGERFEEITPGAPEKMIEAILQMSDCVMGAIRR